MWGWEATLAVRVTNDPQRETTFPRLVLGMTLNQPAREPGANATRALEPMHAAGVPAGYLIGDRAYGNPPKPDDFQRPARAMGYGLLYNMKATDVGQVHMFNGVAMLEGNAYSPSIRAILNSSPPPPICARARSTRPPTTPAFRRVSVCSCSSARPRPPMAHARACVRRLDRT